MFDNDRNFLGGLFHVYGSSTYQILKDQQIEFTDILVEGDSLVLVRNEKMVSHQKEHI